MTDAEFARAFERGEIAPADFHHIDHLRIAWVYLREAPSIGDAIERIRSAIRQFAAGAGQSAKYHETLTLFWMYLLADAARRHDPRQEFAAVLAAQPSLADKNLPLTYYTRDRLFSDAARISWVDPDLQPAAIH